MAKPLCLPPASFRYAKGRTKNTLARLSLRDSIVPCQSRGAAETMKPTVPHSIVPNRESRQCRENCRYRSSSTSSCQGRVAQTNRVDRSDEPGRKGHLRTTTRLRRDRQTAPTLLAVRATLSHNPGG